MISLVTCLSENCRIQRVELALAQGIGNSVKRAVERLVSPIFIGNCICVQMHKNCELSDPVRSIDNS